MEKAEGIIINEGLTIGKIYYFRGLDDLPSKNTEKFSTIIVAENLTPTETVKFRSTGVKALVTTAATSVSHTAILSRTMDWPALSNIKIKKEWNNKTAIVDGYNGLIIIDPDEETIYRYQLMLYKENKKRKELLSRYKGQKSITHDGKRIRLYANIATTADLKQVLVNDAEGIGNFKTEFLYLDRKDYPTEDELFVIYKKVAEQMKGKRTIIRTFDIGTDKTADYFNLEKEENPALGYRAIRIGFDHPEVLRTQIRAIIRASAFGKVSIMYPMIVSIEEVSWIKGIVNEIMIELRQDNIPFDEKIEQGIMVETPAAVIISDELAQAVDFFSIGTNDLIQYILAADRQNAKLCKIYNPYHPAIMRAIQHVVNNAHKAGIWVEISGELGSDPTMIKQFIDCGVDALAVPPAKILPLRKHICEM